MVVTNFFIKALTHAFLFSGVTAFNSLSADFESKLMPRSGNTTTEIIVTPGQQWRCRQHNLNYCEAIWRPYNQQFVETEAEAQDPSWDNYNYNDDYHNNYNHHDYNNYNSRLIYTF